MPLFILLCLLAASLPAQDNPAYAEIDDAPGLPRVLLIGDSISVGYTLPTRELLGGIANVHRLPENGGPTIRGMEKLAGWLGECEWDLIHFNFGLHDLRFMDDGKHQVPLAQYERNLEELTVRLKKTGARLVWASTTPVPAGELSPPRRNSDVVAYNEAAARVMAKHGVPVHDLYGFAQPILPEIQRPANVHFTDEGSRRLAERVAATIREGLSQ